MSDSRSVKNTHNFEYFAFVQVTHRFIHIKLTVNPISSSGDHAPTECQTLGLSKTRTILNILLAYSKTCKKRTFLPTKENLAKFEHFFNNYICPELFEKRILSKVIVRSIFRDIINASTCAS